MPNRRILVPLAVALAASACLAAGLLAQAPGETPGALPDLQTLLFKASDALGILRGLKQEDSLTTLEFWANGTMQAGGRAARVTSYRGSLRFRAVPAMRADITRTAPDGKAVRVVEAVAGPFAWNETEPGVNGSAAPDAAPERMLFLRTLPPGLLKGARLAGANARITRDGAFTVLTYPVPEVAGATLTASINARYLIERVTATRGPAVIETAFSNYADWNAKDYKADIWFPGRIVQKRDGVTVLDLTVTKTNTYNPYVVVPVPPAVGTLEPPRGAGEGGGDKGTYR